MSVATATSIGLDVHHSAECAQFAQPLLTQLDNGLYDECAVLALAGRENWREAHRTARKRADRAYRRGYCAMDIWRHRHADDIQRINLSAPVRQGRPMTDGYRKPPSTTPDEPYRCYSHGVHCYGVFDRDVNLVAYCFVYRAGELALVSQILGHADHLANEIMYLLVEYVVEAESSRGGYLVYNRYDSGTDGLRFFKDRCGFQPTVVEWSQW